MKPAPAEVAEALVDVLHIRLIKLHEQFELLWDALEKAGIDPEPLLKREEE